MTTLSILGLTGLCLALGFVLTTTASRNNQLLVFPGVHREQALDILALTEYLVETRHYDAYVLVPDPLFPGFEDSAIEPRSSNEDAEDDAAEARGECTLEDNVRPGSLTLIRYHSVGFEEYQAQAKDSISELTSVLDFHLANCASLMVNRTLMDSLAKPAGGGGAPFTAMLGVATDPCAALLADRLRIRRRAAYDDGSATSLLWGVLLGQGHATSHVAAYGTGLGGGGSMGLYQKTRNVLQYYKVQMWHARVYGPRVAAFRSRHRVRPLYGEGPRPLPCHMKGQVIITGADWGLLEPQPLPPAVKLVGPLRAGPSQAAAALQPPELAAHVAAAEHGVAVIAFPPDYRPPLRALLAVAEAVLDLKQHIVWQASAADIARVKQVYLPLKHARKVLMMPDVPVQDLLAHANVVSIITAGSVQAIYAAIYAAKPVMAVPLNAAQEDLVARLAALGAGQRLSRAELEGGAASYRVSVAIERMSNVYSFTASMQQLSTQLRAALGRTTALERAAAWVDYTAALDDLGRQYLQPLQAATGAAAPAAGGGGGCMGLVAATNTMAYLVIVGVGVGAAVLAGLVFHICTRVPPPPKRKARLVLKEEKEDDAEEREHERVEAEVVKREQEREGLRERHRAKEREKERAREKERERERRRERERQQALRDIAAEREAEEQEERARDMAAAAARARTVHFQRQEVEDVDEDDDDDEDEGEQPRQQEDEEEEEQDEVDVPVRTSRTGNSKDKDA
ncbi:hypothetical protein CHLRE_02g080500v5 [Chlamydomonas reinhardtii]|uniref:Uncharacterized protein n=1 Tax=Chlamydomonas reinhardtii TaxID=3055 RepID=A0A2K3E0H4_CHLRE|nr:uncharacterized protein CHLRE_02g080500v5 [Chlamydomonas reinhardtii]PNW86292.1 hypothetical protein CHLRE_02g080500v5 [Chlamydomonas reinhardtii]